MTPLRCWAWLRWNAPVVLSIVLLAACGTSRQQVASDPAAEAVASAWGMQGTGSETSDPMELPAGTATIECRHEGTSDFVVDILDASGSAVQHLVSPAGDGCSSQPYTIADAGTYRFRITADGPWEINVINGDSGGVTETR